jgi:addiction module RelE/StbE family toxin
MVPKIEWTAQSKNDLLKIKEYVAPDSLFQAKRTILFITQFKDSNLTRKLARPPTPQINMKVRRILVKNYRVIYVFDSEVIFILSVQHQASQLGTDFD